MKNSSSHLYVRRKSTNWGERGIDAWVNDVESMCATFIANELNGYVDLARVCSEPSRIYFSLAARSRAKACAQKESESIDRKLFGLRSAIERAIYKSVVRDLRPFEELIFKKGFFGYSLKQGVTVRFPLFSCVPTEKCGGRCYAHDGRDKHFSSIARGVFNYIALQQIALELSGGVKSTRISSFTNQIDKAVAFSLAEAARSADAGFSRPARIRLSHVGEMADLPEMTNWIATELLSRSNGRVTPVLYTRHPNALKLDTSRIVVNFTIESDRDPRRKYAPKRSRLVGSSWGGEVFDSVAVNFLEHHGDRHFVNIGSGTVCPVTANHESQPTCDSAKCTKCFSLVGN